MSETFDNSAQPEDFLPRPPEDELQFVPTLARPMPTFQCTKIKKDGERCKNMALRGMLPEKAKCSVHGGSAPGVVEAAEARKDAVRLVLLDNSELAAQTLESLMDPSVSDAVRLKAATEVLDRTIGKTPLEVNVNETVTINPAEKLLNELARLADNDSDLEIEEGEIVEDDDSDT